MAVDINGIGGRPQQTNTQAADKQQPVNVSAQPVPVAPLAAPQSNDSVTLSSEAQKMQAVQDRVVATGEVDQARVDAIRASIANGSFTVDANKVASAMLGLNGG